MEESQMFANFKKEALFRCMKSRRRYMDELVLVVLGGLSRMQLRLLAQAERVEIQQFFEDYVQYAMKMREAGMQ